MNTSLQIKRLNRLNKNQFTDLFTIGNASIETFFKKLKDNISTFPDKTRFQLVIVEEDTGHFWMVDCYVRNGQLHTFTLDAPVIYKTLEPTLNILNKFFPNGKHYHFDKNYKGIQTTNWDCWAFTREHISMVSKMDPDALYSLLAVKTKSSNRVKNTYRFTVNDLDESMSMLVPLFRGMQSMEGMNRLLTKFNTTIVSTKKEEGKCMSLKNWVVKHTVSADQPGQNNPKNQNHSINHKAECYKTKFKNNNVKFFNDRSGFGFITFPTLTIIKDIILRNDIDLATIKKTAEHLATTLKQKAPKHRKAISFIKAKHAGKTNEVIAMLEKLQSEPNKSKFIHQFCDTIYAYAGYLDKYHSIRTLSLLRNTFSVYEQFYKGDVSELPYIFVQS